MGVATSANLWQPLWGELSNTPFQDHIPYPPLLTPNGYYCATLETAVFQQL